MTKLCPCCSGKSYEACCKPLHEGIPAPTALALMRSRFSAYALGLVDYILRTTHPQNPKLPIREDIQQFCAMTKFNRLEILDFAENTVTFEVFLSQGKKDFSYREKSQFEKIDGNWLYLSGEVS